MLIHIKELVCVECGDAIVKERWDGTHCNGERFESREFQCGRIITYSPNYSRLIPTERCSKTSDFAKESNKFSSAKSAIISLAKETLTKSQYKRFLYAMEFFIWSPKNIEHGLE